MSQRARLPLGSGESQSTKEDRSSILGFQLAGLPIKDFAYSTLCPLASSMWIVCLLARRYVRESNLGKEGSSGLDVWSSSSLFSTVFKFSGRIASSFPRK